MRIRSSPCTFEFLGYAAGPASSSASVASEGLPAVAAPGQPALVALPSHHNPLPSQDLNHGMRPSLSLRMRKPLFLNDVAVRPPTIL